MDDPPRFESPITRRFAVGDGPLTLLDRSATTKLIVKAQPDSVAADQLAVRFGRSRRAGDVLICGQRPGEWMLLGPRPAVEAQAAELDRRGHVSVIDHTHGRALLRLAGPWSAEVLAKICSLDLDDAMTPDGAVTSASVAQVSCDITRDDQDGSPSYLLACDRSFAQYLFDAILDAGSEFGLVVRPS